MEVLKWNDHQNYFGWTIGTLGNAYPIDKVSQSQYVSGIYSLTYIDSIPTGNTPQLSFVLKGLAMEVMLEITVRTEF